VKLPSRRRALLLGVFTLLYAGLAMFVVALSGVATCSMQPDIAAGCDVTPIVLVILFLAFLYVILAVRFLRAKLDGVD